MCLPEILRNILSMKLQEASQILLSDHIEVAI